MYVCVRRLLGVSSQLCLLRGFLQGWLFIVVSMHFSASAWCCCLVTRVQLRWVCNDCRCKMGACAPLLLFYSVLSVGVRNGVCRMSDAGHICGFCSMIIAFYCEWFFFICRIRQYKLFVSQRITATDCIDNGRSLEFGFWTSPSTEVTIFGKEGDVEWCEMTVS